MNISAYFFGWILATHFAALFHLWRNGGFGKLLFFLIISWAGFFLGHLAFHQFNIKFMTVGNVQIAGGIVGSLLFLFLGQWFSNIKPIGE